MSAVPVSPRRVFGVDFSGARDAGRRIWLCRAHPGDTGIRIESVDPLCELPGGAVAREPAFQSLVQKVVTAPRSAWGFDFSFGLPRTVYRRIAPNADDLAARLDAIAALGDADALRARCREAAPGVELRRHTDVEKSTPFSPYNVRIYRQTYHGMASVLKPLCVRPEVAVLPFDGLGADPGDADAGRLAFNRSARGAAKHVYVMEVCPASVLQVLEYPARGYKARSAVARDLRETILRRLIDDGLVRPAQRALRHRIVDDPHGDALDAVLAAVGAWRGYREYDHHRISLDPLYGVEGFVFT